MKLNRESIFIFLPALGSMLWAAGGTWWTPLRRYVLPLTILTWFVYYNLSITDDEKRRKNWWKGALSCVLMMGAFSLGYGDGKAWWYRALVGLSYPATSLPMGLSVWQIITPVVFISMFWLSNNWLQGEFLWKICEASIGFTIGIMYARLIEKGTK